MSKARALVLFFLVALFVVHVSAIALQPCSVLHPTEIAATLRVPGAIVFFGSKDDQDHLHTCFLTRISKAESFEENLKRYQSETPPTLTVTIIDGIRKGDFPLLKAEANTPDVELPMLGDRAVLRRSPSAEKLMVVSGSTLLILGYSGIDARKHEQDLQILAQEAISTNFTGVRLTKFQVAELALANDKSALESDPKNFAILLFAMNKMDEARKYNLQALALSPDDPDVLYMQGVMDWISTYSLRMKATAQAGLNPTQPLSESDCANVKAANQQKVEEGTAALTKAVKLRPNFSDAMAYLNMLYRERAAYECDDTVAHAADLKTANEWLDKTIAAMKSNPSKLVGTNQISMLPPAPPLPPGGVPGGAMGGVLGSVSSATPANVTKTAAIPRWVQVSEGESQSLLISQVPPVYPQLARQARIQGTVVLKAVIAKDGSIESLETVSGHPMLVPAAIEAVKQWRYKPYYMNGEPVEVQTEIDVNFTLAGG